MDTWRGIGAVRAKLGVCREHSALRGCLQQTAGMSLLTSEHVCMHRCPKEWCCSAADQSSSIVLILRTPQARGEGRASEPFQVPGPPWQRYADAAHNIRQVPALHEQSDDTQTDGE